MKKNNNRHNDQKSAADVIYPGLLKEEIQSICEMFCVVQATILSMIRNAVFVLPNYKLHNIKSYNLPKTLSQFTKNGTIRSDNVQYDQPITTKDILLYALKNPQSKQLLEKIISKVNIPDHDTKIRITIKKNGFQNLNPASQANLKQDIAIIEQIINAVNTRFIQLLPEAKQKAQQLMAQLENSRKKIPANAKFETTAHSKKNF